jgi:hypothetical protein
MTVPAVTIVEIIHVLAMFVSYAETIHALVIPNAPIVDTILAFAVRIVVIIPVLVAPFAAILLALVMTEIQILTIRMTVMVPNVRSVED